MSDYNFDFGFSAVTEEELAAVQKKDEEIKSATDAAAIAAAEAAKAHDKANQMYKMITPLLDNLVKDPEKEYIYWPNRQAKIKAFKEQLQKILK